MKYDKGWGHEIWMHNSAAFCFKQLVFNGADCKTSLHFHIKKCEMFYVCRGTFELTMVSKEGKRMVRVMEPQDFQFIPCGMPHRVKCVSVKGGVVLEASSQHFEEDSYRVEPGDSQKA